MTRVDDGTHQAHTELTWWPPKQNRVGSRCFEAFFHPPPLPLHHLPPSSPLHLHRVNIFLGFLSSPLSCSPLPPHGVGCSTEHTCSTSTHLQSGSSYLQLQTFLFYVAKKSTKHNLLNSRISLTLNSRISR